MQLQGFHQKLVIKLHIGLVWFFWICVLFDNKKFRLKYINSSQPILYTDFNLK